MKLKLLTLVLALTIILTACGGGEGDSSSSSEAGGDNSQSSSSSEESLPAEAYLNPLTGLPIEEDMIGLRPMSVMINNIRNALPQHGIGGADMWYETLAEGGITRIMAIYSDYRNLPEQVGPVRSVREYYLDFALPHETLFVHYGSSYPSRDVIAAYDLMTFDGDKYGTQAFWLDTQLAAERGGREHANFTNSEYIQVALDGEGADVYSSNDYIEPTYNFAPEGERAYEGDMPATDITVGYSSYTTATFTYDAESMMYLKGQFGGAHIDAITGEQIAADNVLILFADTELHPAGSGLLQLDLTSGTGYRITGGTAQEIRYTKGDIAQSFELTDMSGGEVILNAGKTYICVVDSALENKVVIE